MGKNKLMDLRTHSLSSCEQALTTGAKGTAASMRSAVSGGLVTGAGSWHRAPLQVLLEQRGLAQGRGGLSQSRTRDEAVGFFSSFPGGPRAVVRGRDLDPCESEAGCSNAADNARQREPFHVFELSTSLRVGGGGT